MASMGISHAAEMPAPAEGTAAAAALKANAERRVTRIDKMVKLHKRKPPTKVRKDGESAPVVVPGKLITRENDMYIMTIGMMLGLRVSLYYNATNADEEVAEQDFHSGDHYLFPPEGCSKPGLPQTPRHHLAHTFKFKDYAPKIFHRIRLLSGIDTKSYMDSVSGDANFVQFTSNSKSGQFFFFTPDGDYMVKTVSHEEVKELLKVMPRYFQHLEAQPASFLCRVLGMYRVQMYQLHRTVYFIVMASTWKGATGRMDAQYDCKGSQVGRNAAVGESVRKDNDLLEDGFRLRLGANREPVLHQVRSDVELLRSLGFLDYSLLIGAQWRKPPTNRNDNDDDDQDPAAAASSTAADEAASMLLQAASGDAEDEDDEEGGGNSAATAAAAAASSPSSPPPTMPPPPPTSRLSSSGGGGGGGGFFRSLRGSYGTSASSSSAKQASSAATAANSKKGKSSSSSSTTTPPAMSSVAQKEINEDAFNAMAADLDKQRTESRDGGRSPFVGGGVGGGGLGGGGSTHSNKTIDQVANMIYVKQSADGSGGGVSGRRPSLADLHLDPHSPDPHDPQQPLNAPAAFVASPHGPLLSPSTSSANEELEQASRTRPQGTTPPTPGQRPAGPSRRVSSRTLMLEYTRRWEKSLAPSGALAEEAVLAQVVRNRISVDSSVRCTNGGGLPAAPLPVEAPWVLPKPHAVAGGGGSGGGGGGERGSVGMRGSETKDERRSGGSSSSSSSSSRRSTSFRGSTAKAKEKGSSQSSSEEGGADGGGGDVEWSMASPMKGQLNGGEDLDALAGLTPPVDVVGGEEAVEYRLGVIDFLTKYGINKMAERSLKSFKYEKKGLSVAPPDEYAARLVAFVEGICIGDGPCAELGPGGGYLVQLVFKPNNGVGNAAAAAAQTVGLELGNKSSGGIKMEAAWKKSSSSLSSSSSGSGSGAGGRSRNSEEPGSAAASAVAAGATDNEDHNNNGSFEGDRGAGGGNQGAGVVVLRVKEGSPAALAGARAGDRIHRINGELVPRNLSHRNVTDRIRKASRPLYLSLERHPTPRARQLARERLQAEEEARQAAVKEAMDAQLAPPPPLPQLPSTKEEEGEGEEGGGEKEEDPSASSSNMTSSLAIVPDVTGKGEVFGNSPLSSPKVVASAAVDAAVAGVFAATEEKRSRSRPASSSGH